MLSKVYSVFRSVLTENCWPSFKRIWLCFPVFQIEWNCGSMLSVGIFVPKLRFWSLRLVFSSKVTKPPWRMAIYWLKTPPPISYVAAAWFLKPSSGFQSQTDSKITLSQFFSVSIEDNFLPSFKKLPHKWQENLEAWLWILIEKLRPLSIVSVKLLLSLT